MLYSRPSQSDPLAVVMGSGSVGGAEPEGRWPPPRWGTDVAPSPTHLVLQRQFPLATAKARQIELDAAQD